MLQGSSMILVVTSVGCTVVAGVAFYPVAPCLVCGVQVSRF